MRIDDLPIVTFPRRIYDPHGSDSYVSYTIFMPKDPSISGTLRPCIFYIHPGGPVAGYDLFRIEQALRWVIELKFVCVTVDYLLAPEYIYPAAPQSCSWVMEDITKYKHFSDQQISTGIDLGKVCIMAGQGGAAIAVDLVLGLRDFHERRESRHTNDSDNSAAKDAHVPSTSRSKKRKLNDETNDMDPVPTKQQCASKKETSRDSTSTKVIPEGIRFKGMLLYSPMIDYRLDGVSAAQFKKGGYHDVVWSNRLWALLLRGTHPELHDPRRMSGKDFGGSDDLDNLPATFIEVGSCETYRSEAVRFAEQMWRRGGDCELHVWPGANSGFTSMFPGLQMSKSANEARRKWLERTLCGVE